MSQQSGKQRYRKRLLTLCISATLVGILVIVGAWGVLSGAFKGAYAGYSNNVSTQSAQVSSPVSPLLFGTNMGLFNSNDQLLHSANTRALLQKMHVRIIRTPVRSSL